MTSWTCLLHPKRMRSWWRQRKKFELWQWNGVEAQLLLPVPVVYWSGRLDHILTLRVRHPLMMMMITAYYALKRRVAEERHSPHFITFLGECVTEVELINSGRCKRSSPCIKYMGHYPVLRKNVAQLKSTWIGSNFLTAAASWVFNLL